MAPVSVSVSAVLSTMVSVEVLESLVAVSAVVVDSGVAVGVGSATTLLPAGVVGAVDSAGALVAVALDVACLLYTSDAADDVIDV